jgi:hypothetical protein
MTPVALEKRTAMPKEALLPVTRIVSTLAMTIQNGQLVAKPLISLRPVTAHVVS